MTNFFPPKYPFVATVPAHLFLTIRPTGYAPVRSHQFATGIPPVIRPPALRATGRCNLIDRARHWSGRSEKASWFFVGCVSSHRPGKGGGFILLHLGQLTMERLFAVLLLSPMLMDPLEAAFFYGRVPSVGRTSGQLSCTKT